MIRRDFFTAIGAAVAAVKMGPAEGEGGDIPVLVISPDACILCGYDKMLKSWEEKRHPGVMRCADRMGCQCRQIDALLGELTPWQKRTGVVTAKGKRST